MKNFLDKLIVAKIKSKFESHQPEYEPVHWKMMQEKLQARQNTVPLWPIMAKAAGVALLASVTVTALFLNSLQSGNSNGIVNNNNNVNQLNESSLLAMEQNSSELKLDAYWINPPEQQDVNQTDRQLQGNGEREAAEAGTSKENKAQIPVSAINTAKIGSLQPNSDLRLCQTTQMEEWSLNIELQAQSFLSHNKGIVQSIGAGIKTTRTFRERISVTAGLLVSHIFSNHGYFNELDSQNETGRFASLEIPINVQLKLAKRNNCELYAGLGGSAVFQKQLGQILPNQGSTDNYYMNITAGVKFPVGKGRAVVEPFLRIPVQDLDRGARDSSSTGLSIKYNFNIG